MEYKNLSKEYMVNILSQYLKKDIDIDDCSFKSSDDDQMLFFFEYDHDKSLCLHELYHSNLHHNDKIFYNFHSHDDHSKNVYNIILNLSDYYDNAKSKVIDDFLDEILIVLEHHGFSSLIIDNFNNLFNTDKDYILQKFDYCHREYYLKAINYFLDHCISSFSLFRSLIFSLQFFSIEKCEKIFLADIVEYDDDGLTVLNFGSHQDYGRYDVQVYNDEGYYDSFGHYNTYTYYPPDKY